MREAGWRDWCESAARPRLGTSPSSAGFSRDGVRDFSIDVFPCGYSSWIPACAGMTKGDGGNYEVGSGNNGDLGRRRNSLFS